MPSPAPVSNTSVFANPPCISAIGEMMRICGKRDSSRAECREEVAAPLVPVSIIAFSVLRGCLGGWLAIAPTATAGYFGTGDYPGCCGMVFPAFGTGAIAGPQLAGFMRTTTGNYLGLFPCVPASAVIGFFIAFLLMKPPHPET
jgi:hypothetical protein